MTNEHFHAEWNKLKNTPINTDDDNKNGERCKDCKIAAKCVMRAKNYETLCFKQLQNDLIKTNIWGKFGTGALWYIQDSEFDSYIKTVLNNLDEWPGPSTRPLKLWYRYELDKSFLFGEFSNIAKTPLGETCYQLGRRVLEKLRERGYKTL